MAATIQGTAFDDIDPPLSVIKSVDKPIACTGDILTYTVVIQNASLIDALNVVFTDPIPTGTGFVPGTVTVNGAPTAGNPSAGISLGTIPASSMVTVKFQVQVGVFPISNTASVVGTNVTQTFSNTVSTSPTTTTLNVQKQVDRTFAHCGEIMVYTTTITNNGPNNITNVIFTDSEPCGTTFLPNTLSINGVVQFGANPNAGILLGSLPVGNTIIVQFQVVITTCSDRNITNTSTVTYCGGSTAISNQVLTFSCCNCG